MTEILTIIPARGGSKGIPKKNIAPLAGKPLIAWVIEAALASKRISRLIVDTDSEEIAAVAREWGAETPYMRPEEYARDNTPSIVTLQHSLRWFEEHEGYVPDYLMCLQATTPFLTTADIDGAVALLEEKQAEALVSVSPAKHPPQWLRKVDEDDRLQDYFPAQPFISRRQDVAPAYELNGAIFIARPGLLLEKGTWYVDGTCGYVMENEVWVDIDTPFDLQLADLVMRNLVDSK
ncbi:MAG: acylneuraminate cytidylyltransferase family protein [Anaerolineaceae bacterium]|jgi:N-acylneuraminate cytidylyltransferase/CMP-N,N'-diacetyllegionaminic acid synthase|nr:acylneuraminate cytidylyltransferase family protein [Anaerolineaceae bacterium]